MKVMSLRYFPLGNNKLFWLWNNSQLNLVLDVFIMKHQHPVDSVSVAQQSQSWPELILPKLVNYSFIINKQLEFNTKPLTKAVWLQRRQPHHLLMPNLFPTFVSLLLRHQGGSSSRMRRPSWCCECRPCMRGVWRMTHPPTPLCLPQVASLWASMQTGSGSSTGLTASKTRTRKSNAGTRWPTSCPAL